MATREGNSSLRYYSRSSKLVLNPSPKHLPFLYPSLIMLSITMAYRQIPVTENFITVLTSFFYRVYFSCKCLSTIQVQ